MRRAANLAPEDSLESAAARLRESGAGLVPVVDDGRIVGVITEAAEGSARGGGLTPFDSVRQAAVRAQTIPPYATAAEALRNFADGGPATLVVADDAGRVLGVLSPSDLYPKHQAPIRPPMVGGMATPFGVYLTTGGVSAGPGGLALVATGGALFSLFLLGALLSYWVAGLMIARGASGGTVAFVEGAVPLVVFLAGMRLLPLSGIHAAEHKVVHAIERGEELRPEIVRRMPRVHPRCGTNLAVGASLFLGIAGGTFIPYPEIRLLLAAFVTLALWRPLGSFAQRYITTRKPTERHLAMGIRTGQQLLDRYATSRLAHPGLARRLWASGMFHVMAGSMICYTIVMGIAKLFGWSLPL